MVCLVLAGPRHLPQQRRKHCQLRRMCSLEPCRIAMPKCCRSDMCFDPKLHHGAPVCMLELNFLVYHFLTHGLLSSHQCPFNPSTSLAFTSSNLGLANHSRDKFDGLLSVAAWGNNTCKSTCKLQLRLRVCLHSSPFLAAEAAK